MFIVHWWIVYIGGLAVNSRSTLDCKGPTVDRYDTSNWPISYWWYHSWYIGWQWWMFDWYIAGLFIISQSVADWHIGWVSIKKWLLYWLIPWSICQSRLPLKYLICFELYLLFNLRWQTLFNLVYECSLKPFYECSLKPLEITLYSFHAAVMFWFH